VVLNGVLLLSIGSCTPTRPRQTVVVAPSGPSFGAVMAVLEEHTDVVVLGDGTSRVAVVPQYQGRIMTSTFGGDEGPSLGWVNLPLIASGKHTPQFSAFGGAERFWLGPEGSQFSIFFDAGKSADFSNWRVPAVIDTDAWSVAENDSSHVSFVKELTLTNQSGFVFEARVGRTVRLLDRNAVAQAVAAEIPVSVELVAYQSENQLTNIGKAAWTESTGMLSIWILGMLPPGDKARIVAPVSSGPGKAVNDDYFGKIPPGRLAVKDKVVVMRADGKERGKIGIPRTRARDVIGSWDPSLGVLTLAQFSMPPDATAYVNAKWGPQPEPFAGDVANAYNDGPTPSGAALGPFYELESSSPAAALSPGDSLTHVHRTVHLRGDNRAIDVIAQKVLGVSLVEIENALP
jgi:hypothetical protein